MENKNTDRLIVIHNPNSTRADRVGREVFDVLKANGRDYAEHVTQYPDADRNIQDMRELFERVKKMGEQVTALNIGGDGTNLQAANAILLSGADVTMGSIHGGNFGDATRMHKGQSVMDVIDAKTVTTYPLTVEIDDRLWHYVPGYVTAGWTGEAAAQFGDAKSRELMKAMPSYLKTPISLVQILGNYVRNSRKKLPAFRIDGSPELHDNATDIMIANNPTIGRIVKFPVDYGLEPDAFGVNADIKVSDIGRSALFAIQAVRARTPHERVSELQLLFESALNGGPAELSIQGDGEFAKLKASKVFVYKDRKNALPVLDARL